MRSLLRTAGNPLATTGTSLARAFGAPQAARSQAATAFAGVFPGTGVAITVVEGPGESRGTGSYVLRTYEILDPDWPFDSSAAGLVCARDGAVEALHFDDADWDGNADVIVVVRSASSGGHLSADAFAVRGRTVRHRGSVGRPASAADPENGSAKRSKPNPSGT